MTGCIEIIMIVMVFPKSKGKSVWGTVMDIAGLDERSMCWNDGNELRYFSLPLLSPKYMDIPLARK
jgi:hypothetical protein